MQRRLLSCHPVETSGQNRQSPGLPWSDMPRCDHAAWNWVDVLLAYRTGCPGPISVFGLGLCYNTSHVSVCIPGMNYNHFND